MADRDNNGRHKQEGYAPESDSNGQNRRLYHGVDGGTVESSTLANADSSGRNRWPEASKRSEVGGDVAEWLDGDVGDPFRQGLQRLSRNDLAPGGRQEPNRLGSSSDDRNGSFWSDHAWLTCHDGKARRTKPGLPLLVDGLPGRVAAWRGFGNAIVAPLAAEVIAALRETI
jgi:DNA (cytosine-5)-methyltransferase 1